MSISLALMQLSDRLGSIGGGGGVPEIGKSIKIKLFISVALDKWLYKLSVAA